MFEWPLIFLKAAIKLVDLLFIELMFHISCVKQLFSLPINLTHELIFCTEIMRGREDFQRDSAVKGFHSLSSVQGFTANEL